MAKVFVNETNLRNIGDAIREKNESNQTYKPSEMAAAIDALPVYPEPTGTKAISSNGVHDVKDYANANVDVPNSYAAGDEGKVVSNGALVSQGSLIITENDTYDTTLISELIANISGGGGGSTNILSGTEAPTSSQGSDGAIYLQYHNEESDIEYITNSSNNSYIPLGYEGPKKELKFVVECNVHGGGSYATPIGARTSVTANNFLLFFKYGGSYNAKYGMNSIDLSFGDLSSYVDKKILITLSNSLVRVEDENGNYVEQIPSNQNDFTTRKVMLFNLGTNDAQIYGNDTACYMDVYSCKVYKDNMIVAYYVPQIQNGNIGMVDVFSGKFIAVNGTVTAQQRQTSKIYNVIKSTFIKVSGTWQPLIGSDIDDVDTGN